MGIIEDLLNALDRVPLWKRLGEIPAETDDLKRRVNELEERLGGKWPADVGSLGLLGVQLPDQSPEVSSGSPESPLTHDEVQQPQPLSSGESDQIE